MTSNRFAQASEDAVMPHQPHREQRMKVLSAPEDAELTIADLVVNLGDETHSSPTLCVRYQGSIIPLRVLS